MKYYILYHPEKCCACGACSVACMDQNDVDVSKGRLPFRTVCEYEGGTGSCEYRLQFVLCQELTEGSVAVFRRPTDPRKALSTDATHQLRQLVDLLTGQGGCSTLCVEATNGTSPLHGRGEHTKTAILHGIGQVYNLHSKPGVWLIGAVTLHSFGIR